MTLSDIFFACRRNNMEVELVKSKLDLMNLDGQLMEAIQQKVELSQQLEEWQVYLGQLVCIVHLFSL